AGRRACQGARRRGGRRGRSSRQHPAPQASCRGGGAKGSPDHAASRALHGQRRHDRRRGVGVASTPVFGPDRPVSRMGLMGVKGWEVVFRGERLKADLIAAVLEANGITAEVFGDTAYSAAMNFTEARIMVPDAEANQARQLIEAAESSQV